MPNFLPRICLLTFFFLSGYSLYAQNSFWTDIPDVRSGPGREQRKTFPKKFRSLQLDTARFASFLRTAPPEFSEASKNMPLLISLPMPDGSYDRFSVVETSMMEPGLAAQLPELKTYAGQGIDDPYATIKIDWSPLGLHAMVRSPINGSVFIDPYAPATPTRYLSYHKKDFPRLTPFIEAGNVENSELGNRNGRTARPQAAQCIGGTLRRYRLAVACTGEYARAIGFGNSVTQAQTLSAIVTTVNRVNGIYETELGIRMVLVSNNMKIVFTNPATDSFAGNTSPNTLIDESQDVITKLIGSSNFDIGHTFSTGGGGLAELDAVCRNGRKASGVTGIDPPVGDAYDVDYVAHEMGHQFGANHTFNAQTGVCGGQEEITTNAEPGSGNTIMAYAGICDQNNIQPHSDPHFHALSFDEIIQYTNNGTGNNCAVSIITGNSPPVVNAGSNYIIPKSTPFILTGSATDVDGDALTYSWEQTNTGGPFGDWNNPAGDAPIFKSFQPVPTPVRYFPQLADVTKNRTTIGELLPSYGRTLDFRLTARDNRAGGGGVCSDEINVTVNDAAGPFVITSHNNSSVWIAGTFKTITWDVAKTNTAPINCSNVSIELSVDGGLTFPIQIIANTPNDGSHEIVVPANITKMARVRVKAIGNIFYDMSNADLEIQAAEESEFVFNSPSDVYSFISSTRGTVISTGSLNNFSTPITLSASGNPAGSTVVFAANPITPGTNDSITLTGTVAPGVYDITIKGIAGQVEKSRLIRFIIGAPLQNPQAAITDSVGYPLLATFDWEPTPGALTYTLEISMNANFSTVEQRITNITGTSYILTSPLVQNTEYYWRVSGVNPCGTGPSSRAFLFKTVKIECADIVYSTNVPVEIPQEITTVTSTMEITSGGLISDVDVVGLKGEHDYIGDIAVSLESPAKTEVQLFNGQCEDNEDFDLNFDDDAEETNFPCPAVGTVKPSRPLAAFNGENSTGTWTLKVTDNEGLEGGRLTNWGLRICTYSTSTLPVNWLTFAGRKNDNNTVTVQWSTANETNNRHYEIERSTNGINFGSIGKINAGNNPGTVQYYLFNDVHTVSGFNYYRLKQVDNDGNYSYSQIVRVVIDKTGLQYIVYPNPATDKSVVRMLSEMKQVNIRLNDASGKLILQRNIGTVTTGQEVSLPVKGLSKGLYILTLSTEKGTSTNKVIIQ